MIVLRNETYIFLKYGVTVWNKPVVEGRHTRNLYKKTGSIQSLLKPDGQGCVLYSTEYTAKYLHLQYYPVTAR